MPTIEKQGYKYTEEFGYIPENWEIRELSDSFPHIRNGFVGVATPYYTNCDDGIFYLQSNNIHKGKINEYSKVYITKEFHNKNIKNALKEDDILMVQSGHSGECAVVGEKYKGCNCHALIIMSSNKKSNSNYVSYFLNSEIGQNSLKNLLVGNTIQHILASEVKKQPFVYAPLPEQEKIAEVLGDVDSLIDKTQQLINKKKDLKTATMQKLLTPKEDWSNYIVGNLGNTYSGLSGKNKDSFGNGESLYIPFLNIMNNPVIDTKTLEKVCINSNESQNLCLKDDLFFNTSSETPEEVGMCATLQEEISNLYLNSFCFGYRLKQNIDVIPKFLVYLFRGQYGRRIMQTLAQGSTRYNLPKDKFMEYEVELPKFEEQKRTVAIISDMDSEIEALEKELNKYKDLKTGMMQQLLTGKVRLV